MIKKNLLASMTSFLATPASGVRRRRRRLQRRRIERGRHRRRDGHVSGAVVAGVVRSDVAQDEVVRLALRRDQREPRGRGLGARQRRPPAAIGPRQRSEEAGQRGADGASG